MDYEKIADNIFKSVESRIALATAPLLQKIADLEKRLSFDGPLVARIAELEARDVSAAVAKAVAALPVPKDGKDAPAVDLEAVAKSAAALIPRPTDGTPGKDAPAVDLDAVAKAAAALIPAPVVDLEAIAKLVVVPKPADGKPGADAPPVDLAEVAKLVVVPKPADGKDGHGVAGAMIDRDGSLQITLSNGEVKNLGRVVGKDGADGVSFDAFDLEYLPESHEVLVKATVGTRTKELRYPAGGIRPAGYWRDGTKAKACEAWVHDGSLWIANRETAAKPASNSPDWHIAARKGRDGETTVKTINAGPPVPIALRHG